MTSSVRTVKAFIYITMVFATLLLANIFQVMTLIVRPLSFAVFVRFNEAIAGTWCRFVHFLVGLEFNFVFSGDPLPEREHVFLIANHQTQADIPVIFYSAVKARASGGVRWFAKDIIKYTPLVGWGMLFLGNIFVKRQWHKDQNLVAKALGRLGSQKSPFWVINFLEGTRFTQEKLAETQHYARKRSHPIPQHVLMPRTKGFVVSVHALRDKLDAVYDVTIGYPRKVPTILEFFRGEPGVIHWHLRRFAMGDMPADESGLARWAVERFWEKDLLLAYFHQHGAFPSEPSKIL